jgi:hypothetical protein
MSPYFSGRIVDSLWANMTVPIMNEAFFADHQVDMDGTFFPEESENLAALVDNNSANLESISHFSSPFGLMRPPWNFNPSTYLVRYNNEAGMESFDSDAQDGVLDYFTASTCDDYLSFANMYVRDSTDETDFDTMVRNIGKYLHGHLHENVGGQGGTHAREVDRHLRADYGLEDSDILVIVERSHFFTKTYVKVAGFNSSMYVGENPLSCTDTSTISYIEDEDRMDLMIDEPGTKNSAVKCQCSDKYFESTDTLKELVVLYFGTKYTSFLTANQAPGPDHVAYPQSATPYKLLYNMTFEDAVSVMQLLCGRMSFDGDFVGSSSAWDPIFWVAHPAMERILQRIQFSALNGVTKSVSYNFTSVDDECSGHSSSGKLAWLQGFQLAGSDDSAGIVTDAATLSNAQLTQILDPLGDLYPTMLNYVYDSSGGTGCDELDSLLSV